MSNAFPAARAGEPSAADRRMKSLFERYLSLWVVLCIVAGILLGKIAPEMAQSLDRMAVYVDGAPVVSIPIAVCLFFMMYPIMVKIDFAAVDPGRTQWQAGVADAVRQLGGEAFHDVRDRFPLSRRRVSRR
jgi:hypothetical protein